MQVIEMVSWLGAALAFVACVYSLATLRRRRSEHVGNEAPVQPVETIGMKTPVPSGPLGRGLSVETIGLHVSPLPGPLSREWFLKDRSVEAVYEASNLPDFLPPVREFKASLSDGDNDDLTS